MAKYDKDSKSTAKPAPTKKSSKPAPSQTKITGMLKQQPMDVVEKTADETPKTAGKRKEFPTPSPSAVLSDDKKLKTVDVDDISSPVNSPTSVCDQDSSILAAIGGTNISFPELQPTQDPRYDVQKFLPTLNLTDSTDDSAEDNSQVMDAIKSPPMLKAFQHFLNSAVDVFRVELAEENRKMRKEMSKMNSKIQTDLLGKMTVLSDENDALRNTIADLEAKLENKIEVESTKQADNLAEMKTDMSTKLDHVQTKLAERLEAQEMYGRRNSLRFYGIAESTNGKEDCVKVVQNFLRDKLKLTYDSSYFCRAHRVGALDPSKSRAIIVKLVRHDIKYEIISKRRVLARTGYVIREDVTKERSLLMSELIAYDDKGRRLSIWSNDGRMKAKVGDEFYKIRIDNRYRLQDISAVKAAIDKLPKVQLKK